MEKSKNEKFKKASKGYSETSRKIDFFNKKKKVPEIAQQLWPKKSDFQHPSNEKEKKRKKKKNIFPLNPEGRTPPFRRLTCVCVCVCVCEL